MPRPRRAELALLAAAVLSGCAQASRPGGRLPDPAMRFGSGTPPGGALPAEPGASFESLTRPATGEPVPEEEGFVGVRAASRRPKASLEFGRNTPEGGRLPAPPGTDFSELTPPGGGNSEAHGAPQATPYAPPEDGR